MRAFHVYKQILSPGMKVVFKSVSLRTGCISLPDTAYHCAPAYFYPCICPNITFSLSAAIFKRAERDSGTSFTFHESKDKETKRAKIYVQGFWSEWLADAELKSWLHGLEQSWSECRRVGVGSRHLPPGGILQERYLRGCRQFCRLSDSPCPLFPVPLVSHLHKRAAAARPLKTTSSTTYITILHLTLLHSLQLNLLLSILQGLATSGIFFLRIFVFP